MFLILSSEGKIANFYCSSLFMYGKATEYRYESYTIHMIRSAIQSTEIWLYSLERLLNDTGFDKRAITHTARG